MTELDVLNRIARLAIMLAIEEAKETYVVDDRDKAETYRQVLRQLEALA